MEPSNAPDWDINLAWRQKVAAYWSISWPAWVASFTFMVLVTRRYSVDALADHFSLIAVAGNLAFFGIQAVLTHRLVRKNYRSFRVDVIPEDCRRSSVLSMRDAGLVWLSILGPQLALLLISSLVVWRYRGSLPPETVGGISSLSLGLRFLAVGPYSVGLAVQVKYPGFRLQAREHAHI